MQFSNIQHDKVYTYQYVVIKCYINVHICLYKCISYINMYMHVCIHTHVSYNAYRHVDI